ncbi:MAG: DUF4105 domain-containing protein [Chthoniobacterales bacterium]
MIPLLGSIGRALGWLFLVTGTAWAFGAVWFDFPIAALRHPAALLILCAAVAALLFVRPLSRAKLGLLISILLIAACWFMLKPSNNRNWQPDVAETGWAEISGDTVTLHNIRNCDYRSESDYTPSWETRNVRLSQLTGLDLAIVYWGSPWIAHPIATFRFADEPPLCFSIETRKETGESYSTVAGFYRQYELVYIMADERDVIRLRTNYREGEDVYLYRTVATPAQARRRFIEYLNTLNALRAHPRWYNALTTNCTTTIRTQRPANERMPWDWRLLLNGKSDQMLFERHVIATGGLSFDELKRQSRINERARVANHSPDFSTAIRVGLPSDNPGQRLGMQGPVPSASR